MAKICTPGPLPPQPDQNSGWQFGANRYGPNATHRTSKHPTGLAAWSFPCDLLRGQSLFSLRRGWFRFASAQWLIGYPFDKGSFEGAAGSVSITNIHGILKVPNAFSLYKHYTDCDFMEGGMANFVNFGPPWYLPNYQFTPGDFEPDPPAITDAHWDGGANFSIAISNYDVTNAYQLSVYVTTPNTSLLQPAHLFQMNTAFIYKDQPWDQSIFYWNPQDYLKPWPTGSECLFGARVWVGDPRFYMPSPIAAVNITIGE